MIRPLRLLFATALFLPALAAAQSDARTERVSFEHGTTGTTIAGSIKGDEFVDYLLRAQEGQVMNASMGTDNTANYFNILAPGEDNVAFFIGSVGENQYEGVLPATGDYRLRVYLMRSAARRNEVANYRLEINVAAGAAGNDDTLVDGTEYHATGSIPCAMSSSQPMYQCNFGVRRQGNGTGIVTVTRQDGSLLVVVYENGDIIGAGGESSFNATSDGEPFEVRRESDLTYLTVGEERYEIPDAVINGG